MANRRMISKSISVSSKVNSVSDFAALLFTWMIPHTDDYGVLDGSPGTIKALVVPRRKQTEKQVSEALQELQQIGLVWWYYYENKQYVQFINFEEHQEGLHKRRAPKLPLYKDSLDFSGKFPEIPGNSRLIEQNRIEEKGIEEKRPGNSGQKQYAEFVFLSEEEYQKIIDKFGETEAKDRIERLNLWYGKNPANKKKSPNAYYTILAWARKDEKEISKSQMSFSQLAGKG